MGLAATSITRPRAKGWPIATGATEGVCRHLVRDRLDLSGVRWGPEGVEAAPKLRLLWASGDFSACGSFHT